MGAKLKQKDGSYWVVVHLNGKRRWKKIGTDKRVAQAVVHKVNAQIALGKSPMNSEEGEPTVGEALSRWYEDYRPTFSDSYAQLAEINIRLHLGPAFGHLRLSEVSERLLLQYIGERIAPGVEKPPKASTLLNILSMLGRVLALAVDEGQLERNPCRNLKKLLGRVSRQASSEVDRVSAWTADEVRVLLGVARINESAFYPFIAFLLSTGCRKGEALGLKWEDVDFTSRRVSVRRALVRGKLGTPKNGRERTVVLSTDLEEVLNDLLEQRRREGLKHGWSEIPEFVFCSQSGGPLDERNVNRTWDRLRRKCQSHGVRPLRLHDARHTFASLALAAGKSIKWTATQLGHSDPALTLRVYAHALPDEETDLSFLDFSQSGGTKRHPRGTKVRAEVGARRQPPVSTRDGRRSMARREGFEPPTLRFEA
jgi:integrase